MRPHLHIVSAPTKAKVITNPGDMTQSVDLLEQLLATPSLGIYTRGGQIVQPALVPINVRNGDIIYDRRIKALTVPGTQDILSRVAEFQYFDEKSNKYRPADAPKRLIEALLVRPDIKLPVLTGIISAPIIRADGSILERPGYDAATGLLLVPDRDYPSVPEQPSYDDAVAAAQKLTSLTRDFCFVDDLDQSVIVCGILASIAAPTLDTKPAIGVTATMPGSGKSLLIDIIAMIATGRLLPVINQGKTDEETEKRLDAALLQGDLLIGIDNIDKPLGGEKLCTMLTQATTRCRPLGRSELVECRSAQMFFNGNNFSVVGDMTRRTLVCRLDPACENPQDREFDWSPLIEIEKNRADYVIAALTILRAFVIAGMPKMASALGSFDDWSRRIRDPLLWLGMPNPCDSMALIRAADPERAARAAVVNAWATLIGIAPLTTKDIISRAIQDHVESIKDRGTDGALRTALMEVAGDANEINPMRFGRWLASNAGRVIDGHRIAEAGIYTGSKRWRLETINDAPAAEANDDPFEL